MDNLAQFESDLWEAADSLRANSKLTSSDYFMPVLGVIFLRHAANRFEVAAKQIEDEQASGKMPKRKILPADYIRRRALWLPETARYDYIIDKAYCSNKELTGVYFGWRRMGDYWFARYQWIGAGVCGFTFLKHDALDLLNGAWW